MATQRQWGITAPFSTNRPTDKELADNDAMLAELKVQNSWEPEERTRLRNDVLKSLLSIAQRFITHIGQRKRMPQNIIDAAGGVVKPFGSFSLGVHNPGSDIDTLILGPKHVTRTDYFDHFPDFLLEHAPKGAVEEMVPVRDTGAPIIKLKYWSVDLDLAYVSLDRSSVPSTIDVKDNALLRNLDDMALRNINGVRNAAEITTLIPQEKAFRHALRAIKLWAKRRALDAHVVGFPGGISWAIMVARMCQLYPNACGSVLVLKTFYLMRMWKWSGKVPVELKERRYDGLERRQYNPTRPYDAAHLLPIITPSYPCMCTTANVSKSTFSIIMTELKRAEDIVMAIIRGEQTWAALFTPSTFFVSDHRYYLAVICSSDNKDDLKKWSSFVNSRVRNLANDIVAWPNDVVLARPYVEGFTRVHLSRSKEDKEKILSGSLEFKVDETAAVSAESMVADASKLGGLLGANEGDADTVIRDETTAKDVEHERNGKGEQDCKGEQDLEAGQVPKDDKNAADEKQETVVDGAGVIYTTSFYIGFEIKKTTNKLDLAAITEQFRENCTINPQFDDRAMTLKFALVRSAHLPPDVFTNGAVRQVKPPKAKKRNVNDAQLDEKSIESAKRKMSIAQDQNGHGAVARTAG